jgi:uncharacterized membrane protein YraQ (UPF0718 family)
MKWDLSFIIALVIVGVFGIYEANMLRIEGADIIRILFLIISSFLIGNAIGTMKTTNLYHSALDSFIKNLDSFIKK